MVNHYNQPKYTDVKRADRFDDKVLTKIIKRTKEIFDQEAFAVLATNSESEAYTCLISFATDEDLTTLVFATPVGTKKFNMIKQDGNVSILIDNRSTSEDDINEIVAITSVGKARILHDQEEIETWSNVLTEKQTYLTDFVCADTTALILVDIDTYYYVSRFQESFEWMPE